jgi:hypothetical protein
MPFAGFWLALTQSKNKSAGKTEGRRGAALLFFPRQYAGRSNRSRSTYN